MHHGIIIGGLSFKDIGRATGAHRIATTLRSQGWDIEVLDFMTSWTEDELEEFFRSRVSSRTVFLGYSYVFHTWDEKFQNIFKNIRNKFPHIKIIVGGMAAQICPLDADYYIDGYGEIAMLEVVKHILGTNTEKLRYTLHGRRKLIRAMLDYPAFPISNFDPSIVYEDRDFIDYRESLVIETARGCKFKCDFCTYPILGVKGDVSRKECNYVTQLQRDYEKWGVENFILADETANDRTEKLEKFANATAKLSFKPNLSGFCRADLLISKKQDWPLLEAMGFWSQWYGIESFNYESAKSIGKGMHPDKIKSGLLEVKDYFLSKGYYKGSMSFIIGLPGETRETVEDAWKWLKNNWSSQAAIYYSLFIPKTELTNEVSKLSSEWKDKGYRIMKKPISWTGPEYTNEGAKTYWREGLSTGVLWENDNLNFEEAHRWVDEFYQDYKNYFGVHTYNQANFRLAFSNINDWIYKKYDSAIRDPERIARTAFMKNYIERKINWAPSASPTKN